MTPTLERIASVSHAVNNALRSRTPALHWEEANPENRESSITGVREVLKGATPEDLHYSWMRHELERGWTFGPEIDEEKKTHPYLVLYHNLPTKVRSQDEVFLSITRSMARLFADELLSEGVIGEHVWTALVKRAPLSPAHYKDLRNVQ